MRACLTWPVLTVVCLAVVPARAQSRDPAAAEVLFRDGRIAAQKGDWEKACPKLRESQRLDPAAGTLLNLADCEEHRGKVATAWQLFREVAEELPSGDERVPLAKQRAAALEKRLPRLTIRLVGSAPAGTKVRRDDLELSDASLGGPLPVDPGTYTVRVIAPGHQTTTARISVAEGSSPSLEVRVGPTDQMVSGGDGVVPNHAAAWVLGGIGLTGFAVGAIAGALTIGRKGTVNDNCDSETKKCNQTGYDAATSGKTLGLVTTAGLVVGALGVGVGAYLLVSGGPAEPKAAVSASLMGDGARVSFVRSW